MKPHNLFVLELQQNYIQSISKHLNYIKMNLMFITIYHSDNSFSERLNRKTFEPGRVVLVVKFTPEDGGSGH